MVRTVCPIVVSFRHCGCYADQIIGWGSGASEKTQRLYEGAGLRVLRYRHVCRSGVPAPSPEPSRRNRFARGAPFLLPPRGGGSFTRSQETRLGRLPTHKIRPQFLTSFVTPLKRQKLFSLSRDPIFLHRHPNDSKSTLEKNDQTRGNRSTNRHSRFFQ